MAEEKKVLISMRDITKTFPGVVALDKAELTLHEGEIHALMGENGAGKSTMIKVLTGVYQRDSGEIHMEAVEGNDQPLYAGCAEDRHCYGLSGS
jgi:monosaccharide-transporting ATPase